MSGIVCGCALDIYLRDGKSYTDRTLRYWWESALYSTSRPISMNRDDRVSVWIVAMTYIEN